MPRLQDASDLAGSDISGHLLRPVRVLRRARGNSTRGTLATPCCNVITHGDISGAFSDISAAFRIRNIRRPVRGRDSDGACACRGRSKGYRASVSNCLSVSSRTGIPPSPAVQQYPAGGLGRQPQQPLGVRRRQRFRRELSQQVQPGESAVGINVDTNRGDVFVILQAESVPGVRGDLSFGENLVPRLVVERSSGDPHPAGRIAEEKRRRLARSRSGAFHLLTPAALRAWLPSAKVTAAKVTALFPECVMGQQPPGHDLVGQFRSAQPASYAPPHATRGRDTA